MAENTNKKKNIFSKALGYIVDSLRAKADADILANQMLADNFDNNPKEQKQLREEMLNHDYGAALSLGSEDSKKIRNTVGNVATDIAIDQSIGKVGEVAAKKGAEAINNRLSKKMAPNFAKIISGQPDKISPKNPLSLKIIDNIDTNNYVDLKNFDKGAYGDGISFKTVNLFDNFFENNRTTSEIIKDLENLEQTNELLNPFKKNNINLKFFEDYPITSDKLYKELNKAQVREMFNKKMIRHKLQLPDGKIVYTQSPLIDFLPQKVGDLDGNIQIKAKPKIFDKGIPLSHDNSLINTNDAFRMAFQDEITRRNKIDNQLLHEIVFSKIDGPNYIENFFEDFPYETFGLDKKEIEKIANMYNENFTKDEINKAFDDYFRKIDFNSIEHEATKEGYHINNRLANGLRPSEETDEWLSNMFGTIEAAAEKEINLPEFYFSKVANQIKNLSKNKGFKATVYSLVNHLSKDAYDRFRDFVPAYQETTAKDLAAFLYNKDWLTEDELIDLVQNMNKDTYFDLIAPVAALEFSDKNELKDFLRYKPAFYHNVIKKHELYPGWKKQFDNSVSSQKEQNLLSNYKDSDYYIGSDGNKKLHDWKMTDTEYEEFKENLKREKRLRTIAPRG